MSSRKDLMDAWKESSDAYRELILIIDMVDGIPEEASTAAKKAISAREHAEELEIACG